MRQLSYGIGQRDIHGCNQIWMKGCMGEIMHGRNYA
jgi:hypothetical protein